MDHNDDGETSYNTFVDDVAFEPTYLQALLTAAGRNVQKRGTSLNRPLRNSTYPLITRDSVLPQIIYACHYGIFKQESRAVARKPRDASGVLFGLKFADDIHCQ